MIKIGTKRDLHKIEHLPHHIQQAISDDIKILDENYGEERNVDAGMGGFVLVCEKNEEINIKHFKKEFEAPEYIQELCPYTKSLYISGTERNIIIYERC